jgi:hypothetical protein
MGMVMAQRHNIKVESIEDGLHPTEALVTIRTASGGIEKLYVDRRVIENRRLRIGHPVGVRQKQFLIELPRETMTGLWRVWVPKDSVKEVETA